MPFIISQDLLKAYCEAAEAENEAQSIRKGLRAQILDLVKNKAPIEPGKFELDVVEREIQNLTWANVAKILDHTYVELLHDEVPPTVAKYVYVRRKAHAKASGKQKKSSNYAGG